MINEIISIFQISLLSSPFLSSPLVILSSYDFDGTQVLSIDEVTLALKSAATGLCKMCTVPAPNEDVVEQLVSAVSEFQMTHLTLGRYVIRITFFASNSGIQRHSRWPGRVFVRSRANKCAG